MADESSQHLYERIDEKTARLPWYVREYVDKKMRVMSPRSLLNYCHDYLIFFDWMIAEGFHQGDRTSVPLESLEKLTPQSIENFLSYLQFRLQNDKFTMNRKLSSLKSLFNYLQNIAETSELKPYLTRNVMAKISFNKIKEDQETVAQKMAGKILWHDEYEAFRQFVASDYRETVKDNRKLLNFHAQNAERDTAIISLILGSGLRLSEVVGLDLHDVDFQKRMVRVVRKGNKEQYVFFSEQAGLDLEDYLNVRAKNIGCRLQTKRCLSLRRWVQKRQHGASARGRLRIWLKSMPSPLANLPSLYTNYATHLRLVIKRKITIFLSFVVSLGTPRSKPP
ncbi:tyrosine recombinase XerC [Sporolactobacillus inulinus]|uniref:Tyrosine recombinase XerC n=1 Tax=Sporolactobacillus inulinus TaxID=2078 RepID=A0A4Y1Z9V7_9BACL|nr:tyrosine recombinase XerC [Sporolactobacillus inulinus]